LKISMFWDITPCVPLTSNELNVLHPEDRTLHNHRCENFKSYMGNLCFRTNALYTVVEKVELMRRACN
jgi:hypothetical protein